MTTYNTLTEDHLKAATPNRHRLTAERPLTILLGTGGSPQDPSQHLYEGCVELGVDRSLFRASGSIRRLHGDNGDDGEIYIISLTIIPDEEETHVNDAEQRISEAEVRPELMTTKEAAEWLRMSHRTLEGMRIHGKGPAFIKWGEGDTCKIVYAREDLQAYIQKNRREVP
mgnify:CR=1 FL=1